MNLPTLRLPSPFTFIFTISNLNYRDNVSISFSAEDLFFHCVILPVKYMYGTWRTLYAHKGLCEHVKCVFLEMYFESWHPTQMFKFIMSQFIFRLPQDVWVDNLDSRCFRLILWPLPCSWGRKWFACVFFMHTNPHSGDQDGGRPAIYQNQHRDRSASASIWFLPVWQSSFFTPLSWFFPLSLFVWFWLCLLHCCPTFKCALCACLF